MSVPCGLPAGRCGHPQGPSLADSNPATLKRFARGSPGAPGVAERLDVLVEACNFQLRPIRRIDQRLAASRQHEGEDVRLEDRRRWFAPGSARRTMKGALRKRLRYRHELHHVQGRTSSLMGRSGLLPLQRHLNRWFEADGSGYGRIRPLPCNGLVTAANGSRSLSLRAQDGATGLALDFCPR